MARSTCGWWPIPTAPISAITTNHSSITGPKACPIRWVPKRCNRNSVIRITTAIGSIQGLSVVVTTLTPSIALSTEIAGVMTPSP